MGEPLFTDHEKRIVARILHREPRRSEGLFVYAAYLLPSVLFALYGVWNRDFAAALVAYVALLIVAVMYLHYTRADAHALHTAVKKYESRIGALHDVGQDAN